MSAIKTLCNLCINYIFLRAFNDALLLQTGAHELVRHNFKDAKCYPFLSAAMSESFRVLNIGQSIMLR